MRAAAAMNRNTAMRLTILAARPVRDLFFDLSFRFIVERFALQNYSIFFIKRRNKAIRSSNAAKAKAIFTMWPVIDDGFFVDAEKV